ncbi:PepSY domain-containing protein [Bdellovibrio sp. ZAP7]|uniref:PepSY-associated TM helix domain-containing protein n=1 Tax=Bdellovibrio sp. ZAP7 TaxID=2231053 RepID=UPI00115AAC60|nr:PepSY-associated TM helix domain-containing protein [Bdellovibrio sp. ZAP7]QDK46036.1 PepSY domain-containing protein [Bdellovibrio sp. ZAP7]
MTLKTKAFRFFYKAHIYLGLFVAVHFIFLSISGSILLFKEEVEGSVHETVAVPAEQTSMSYSTLLSDVLKKFPGERPLAVFKDDEHENIVNVRLGMNDSKMFRGARKLMFDSRTGAELNAEAGKSSFMDWMLKLHREFFLGSYGKMYVGFIGLLYFFVMLSGFFIYGNFAKKVAFGEVRIKSPRHWFSDMHRYIGIGVFAWGLIIGATGFFLGISSTLIKVYQYQELKEINQQYKDIHGDNDHAHNASVLDQVIKTSGQALPNAKVDYIAMPDTQFSPPNHFLVVMVGNTPQTERMTQLVVVDAATGTQGEVRELPWYMKITLASEPLHFGNYGGLFLKIVWLGFSIFSLLLPIFGLVIWYKRKKATQVKGVSMETRKLSDSLLFKNRFAIPLVLFVVTAVMIIGAFILGGTFAMASGYILLIPLILTGAVVLRGKRGKS